MISYHDLETYSPLPITVGTHAYAAVEGAEILIWTYAIEEGPVQCWDVTQGEPMPDDLRKIVYGDSVMVWHNGGMFDMPFLHYRGISLDPRRCYDTRIQAYSCGLPGALGELGEILRLEGGSLKDKEGKALIRRFCCLQKDGSRLRSVDDPAKWALFVAYAKQDIIAMRAIHKAMPRWNYDYTGSGHRQWEVDYHINMRGMPVDVAFAEKVRGACERAKVAMNKDAARITGGAVTTTQQADKTLTYLLAEHGVMLPDMKAATLERRLEDESLPEAVKELLRLRLMSSRAPVAKYKRIIQGATEGRVRGVFQFRGALRTGRAAGRIVQPHNFPREGFADIADVENTLVLADLDLLDTLPDVMDTASRMIRPTIAASDGKMLVVSDWSNIEGRVLAWLCEEQWVLDAFSAFDMGVGVDMYKLEYATCFSMPVHKVTKDQRQVGKAISLSFGYQGGASSFLNFAAVYHIDVEAMSTITWPQLSDAIKEEVEGFYQWALKKGLPPVGLSPLAYKTCEALKMTWRKSRPNTVALWRRLEEAVRSALESPGKTFRVFKLAVRKDGVWLRVRLPSGRYLVYPYMDEWEGSLRFKGICPYKKRWDWVYTHGGKLTENATQAVAADILFESLVRLEEAGFSTVAHIHDEVIAEESSDRLSEMDAILRDSGGWREGLPLMTAGEIMKRYKKG